ncbi:MAG: DUF3466 family protein [Rubrivivax sp.]|nr:DUF3466 family protein [Rubrivivax sp.]
MERRMPSVLHMLAALALSLALTPLVHAQAAPRYAVTELAGVPIRLNNSGQIAGWVYVGADAHAAIYSNGAWRDLGVPAGDQLSALFGINSAGTAVGYSFASLGGSPPDNRWRAITTSADGASVQVLAAISPDSFAYGINDAGVIVGCRNRYDDVYPDPHRAFAYFDGTVTNLHDLLSPPATQTPFDFTCARAVNRAGDIVGEVQLASAPQRGFVFRGGVVTRLETPAGYLLNARAINDLGKIAGEGRLAGFSADHALVFDVGTGAITSLGGEASGAYTSRAVDINGRGDVVGMMFTNIGERAFLASGGRFHDLNHLIPAASEWVLQEGQSINDRGQIVGRGYRTSSPTVTSYFLATPLSPAQATEALIERVNALVAQGVLGKGPGQALVAKLRAAVHQVSLGNYATASHQLSAFIHQVNAQIRAGVLAPQTGQELLDAAHAIVALLAGMR